MTDRATALAADTKTPAPPSPPPPPPPNVNKAIWLLVVGVLFNTAFFLGIGYVRPLNLTYMQSIFLPFLLLLSISIWIGIILIHVLGEKVHVDKVSNSLVGQIGVTPAMVIVAALASLLLAMTPIAEQIFPTRSHLKFLFAKVGITCNTAATHDVPQAKELITLIDSQDAEYISEVREKLEDKPLIQGLMSKHDQTEITLINENDEDYKLLQRFYRQDRNQLISVLSDSRKWVAYKINVKAPEHATKIPIPTVFDQSHRTQLFAVVAERDNDKDPRASGFVPAQGESSNRSLLRLVEFNMKSKRPDVLWQHTEVGLAIITGHTCWQFGG